MGFLKKMQGNYPAAQNRINQQNRPQQQNRPPQQQQHQQQPPSPNRVYNGMPVAPATAAQTAYPSATPTQPVMATAYVPSQASAPVVAQAFVPHQTPVNASAPTVDSLPPPVAPSYNPALQTAAAVYSNNAPYTAATDNTTSKFWECSSCTFPNLRSEDRCKGCGARIPSGMYQPHNNVHHAPVAASVCPPAVAMHVQQQQQHQHPQYQAQALSQQMNNMHITTPSSGTMRVPIPNGMQPGQKIKVNSPDGQQVIKVIPPRHEWSTDEHTGQSFFRMTFGTVSSSSVVAGTALPAIQHPTNHNTSPPPPYTTTWRSFYPRASTSYTPPPIGMRSVPHTPGNSIPIAPNGRHKSLLIGINYTNTRAQLKGCHNDAKNIQRLLKQNGFPDDGSHMLLLTDERSRGNEYQPTASNILKAFKWLTSDLQRGDVLFFHFSGHGGQVPDKTGMESDGYNETLVPLDYTKNGQISDDVLWGSLVYPLPEGVRLTALMDMCHSGTGLDLPFEYSVDTRRWREDVNPAHSRGDVVLFSGCEDAQTSADVQSGYTAGGAMTMAFTEAYRRCDMATYHEFLTVVKRELRRKGMRQRPMLTSSQRFDADGRIFSFGHVSGGRVGGVPTAIESNHNPQVGRKKNRHVRPARAGFGGGGGNDLFAMAAAGAGAMLFANALGNIFD